MDLGVVLQTAGHFMGLARDSFTLNPGVGAGGVSAPGLSPMLGAMAWGSGQAATAANIESNMVNGQVAALGEQSLAANTLLNSVMTAAGAGRAQMDAVISAALADINSLAATTNTYQGQVNLLSKFVGHLQNTSQTLMNGSAGASTFTASSGQLAASLNGLGNFQAGGTGAVLPASFTGGVSPASSTGGVSPMGSPMAAISPTQMMPMLAAQSMAANQAALSQAQQAPSVQQQPIVNGNGQNGGQNGRRGRVHNHPRINQVLSRAMGQRGVPYSWGGGGTNGPSYGIGSGANTRGFDCSGFVRYAYWPFVQLPRTAHVQMQVGSLVARSDIRPGDLIFSEFGEEGPGTGAGHVQMAVGYGPNSQVISAPHTGSHVHVGPMESGRVVVKRLLGLR